MLKFMSHHGLTSPPYIRLQLEDHRLRCFFCLFFLGCLDSCCHHRLSAVDQYWPCGSPQTLLSAHKDSEPCMKVRLADDLQQGDWASLPIVLTSNVAENRKVLHVETLLRTYWYIIQFLSPVVAGPSTHALRSSYLASEYVPRCRRRLRAPG